MTTSFQAGIFLIDKPAGKSSFAAVAMIRRILGIKKVGHAGTLDPFATGLLIVCAGRAATRMIPLFMDGEKEYLTTLRLGIQTTTHDPEGEIIRQTPLVPAENYTPSRIKEVLHSFIGEQMQKPPIYSALKHKGKPLYYYARKGIAVEKEPRPITISELIRIDNSEIDTNQPELILKIRCSKGTYIRVLGADIGTALGCGAYLTSLRRTKSGFFSVDDALTWEDLEAEDAHRRCMEKMLRIAEVEELVEKNGSFGN